MSFFDSCDGACCILQYLNSFQDIKDFPKEHLSKMCGFEFQLGCHHYKTWKGKFIPNTTKILICKINAGIWIGETFFVESIVCSFTWTIWMNRFTWINWTFEHYIRPLNHLGWTSSLKWKVWLSELVHSKLFSHKQCYFSIIYILLIKRLFKYFELAFLKFFYQLYFLYFYIA